jgi:hypothetical protein
LGDMRQRRIGEEPHSTRNQTHYLKPIAGVWSAAGSAIPARED